MAAQVQRNPAIDQGTQARPSPPALAPTRGAEPKGGERRATYRLRRTEYLLVVEGVVQDEGGVTNVLAARLTPLETQ